MRLLIEGVRVLPSTIAGLFHTPRSLHVCRRALPEGTDEEMPTRHVREVRIMLPPLLKPADHTLRDCQRRCSARCRQTMHAPRHLPNGDLCGSSSPADGSVSEWTVAPHATVLRPHLEPRAAQQAKIGRCAGDMVSLCRDCLRLDMDSPCPVENCWLRCFGTLPHIHFDQTGRILLLTVQTPTSNPFSHI